MYRYLSLRLSRLNGEVARLTDLLKAKGILSETELGDTQGSVEASYRNQPPWMRKFFGAWKSRLDRFSERRGPDVSTAGVRRRQHSPSEIGQPLASLGIQSGS